MSNPARGARCAVAAIRQSACLPTWFCLQAGRITTTAWPARRNAPRTTRLACCAGSSTSASGRRWKSKFPRNSGAFRTPAFHHRLRTHPIWQHAEPSGPVCRAALLRVKRALAEEEELRQLLRRNGHALQQLFSSAEARNGARRAGSGVLSHGRHCHAAGTLHALSLLVAILSKRKGSSCQQNDSAGHRLGGAGQPGLGKTSTPPGCTPIASVAIPNGKC